MVCPFIDECEEEVSKAEFEKYCEGDYMVCDRYKEYCIEPPKHKPREWLDRW